MIPFFALLYATLSAIKLLLAILIACVDVFSTAIVMQHPRGTSINAAVNTLKYSPAAAGVTIAVAFVGVVPAVVLVDLVGQDNPVVDIAGTVDIVVDIVDNRTFIFLLASSNILVSLLHCPTYHSNCRQLPL